MNKLATTILITMAMWFAVGCDNSNEEQEISASVSVSARSDGTVEYREPDKKQLEDLDFLKAERERIDRQFPGPPYNPYDLNELELHEINSVSDRGEITLKNGTVIVLEGVNCDVTKRNYLRDFLSDDTDRIVYVPASETNQSPIPVYAWRASLMLMKQPELKDFITGPSFSPLNEGALSSGWCKVEKSATNKYHQRYVALEKLFHKMEERKK